MISKPIAAFLTLAFVILGGVFMVAPNAAVTANQAPTMDIAALTKAAANLPEQDYPAY